MVAIFSPGSSLAAYLRDSGAARQNLSVPQQEGKIRQWCDENHYTLTLIFADVARSGGSTVGRDQLDAMLKHFESGNAKEAGVVFWDYSRWARNFDDGQFFLSSLRRLGYNAHSLEEQIPGGSTGKVVESLYLWSAEQYREQLSRNIKRGQQYLITVHKAFQNYNIPTGYIGEKIQIENRRDGNPHWITRLVLDSEMAPRVRKAFEMRAAGHTVAEIHKATGLYRSAQGYTGLFRNQIYMGVLQWGELTCNDFCEAIVDAVTWGQVQQVNREVGERFGIGHPRRRTSSYLLSGIVRCSLCGGAQAGTTVTRPDRPRGKYMYYVCLRMNGNVRSCDALRIPQEDLDRIVLDRLREHLTTPEPLYETYTHAQQKSGQAHGEYSASVERVQHDLSDLAAQIDRTTNAIAAAGHSQALLAKLAELERLHAEKHKELAELRAHPVTIAPLPEMSIDEVAEVGRRLWARVEAGDARQKQLILRSFMQEVSAAKINGVVTGMMTFYALPGVETKIELPLG